MAKQLLTTEELKSLNVRSNTQGLIRLAFHLGVMGVSGYLWATNLSGDRWYIAVPALVLYGFSFAIMFAPLHESSHRTAFANNQLSDAIAWFAGLLSFYNSTFYRQYHKWHHRYTQIPDQDPELSDPKPTNLQEYLLEISGLPWWIGKIKTHLRVASGLVDDYIFIPEAQRKAVISSTRWQLLVYGLAIAISIGFRQPWFLLYWLLPLAVGQPFLRFILLTEHTGCTNDDNGLTNTRTTLTLPILRYLMWNIPFHTEHHLYPSIPFYLLPTAHEKLSSHFAHIGDGYVNVNLEIINNISGREIAV
ncbi:fatty acid desaturase [Synechococcus sp. PCC 7502]|uniref:fatty acid desaturase family protein n=1 Tax=Synechococcus sp. PCC 7502 TaxID=1173263 RepID=UPI00029F84AE|nr:fatty acid desaturase family protein [Synechococcus sp. PCC 7502]AFY73279.1 fatty acid desaturase [Synechococcus sp. PCC 7502]